MGRPRAAPDIAREFLQRQVGLLEMDGIHIDAGVDAVVKLSPRKDFIRAGQSAPRGRGVTGAAKRRHTGT